MQNSLHGSRHGSMSDTQSTLGTRQLMGRSETIVKLTLADEEEFTTETKVDFTSLTGDVLDIIAEYLS